MERLIGFARRNFLVPVPEVGSIEALNTDLRERCAADRAERTRGKTGTKAELLREDQAAFLPLPKQAFEARRVDQRTADSQSLIRFDDNDYSVPVQYAHCRPSSVERLRSARWRFPPLQPDRKMDERRRTGDAASAGAGVRFPA